MGGFKKKKNSLGLINMYTLSLVRNLEMIKKNKRKQYLKKEIKSFVLFLIKFFMLINCGKNTNILRLKHRILR